MKKLLLILSLIITSSLLFSQEICDNGIDDDGDGLIDLNDTVDCYCTEQAGYVVIPSLIPNPSFEDTSCCPSTYSQLSCADTWMQGTDATSDYMNTCDFVMDAATDAGLVPFPDGDGIVGSIYAETWQEYVGICLSSPLLSNTQYKLVMNIASTPIDAYGGVCNSGNIYYGPIEITIFGDTSCTDLPTSGNGCPGSPWQVIGTQTYTPTASWDTININFTLTQNINALIIGSPCTLPASGYEYGGGVNDTCYPYFYFDNLILNDSYFFNTNLTIDSTGTYNTYLTLNAYSDTIGTFQWYFNGVAISGETNSTLDITGNGYYPGDYQVVFSYGIDCIIGEFNVTTNLAINHNNVDDIIVYPNPSDGSFVVKGNNINTILITDLNGKTVLVNNKPDYINNTVLSDKAKGIYFVRIITKNNTFIRKLVVE